MTLEEEFYKEVTPEGCNNYVLSGQAKVLLSLCKAVDDLRAVLPTYVPEACSNCDKEYTSSCALRSPDNTPCLYYKRRLP